PSGRFGGGSALPGEFVALRDRFPFPGLDAPGIRHPGKSSVMNIARPFSRRLGHQNLSRHQGRPPRRRLCLERLEDRTLPALVAAYGFGEGSGATVADASGNGNVGTISNATWVSGK